MYFGLALLGALYAGTVSLYPSASARGYVAYRTERELKIPRELGLASTYGRARAAGLIEHSTTWLSWLPPNSRWSYKARWRVGKSIGLRALIIILVLI